LIKFDILILVDSGIGNAIEALYAIEYCQEQKLLAAIYLHKVNASFQDYLRQCYGSEVILSSLKNVSTRHLIHSFTYQERIAVEFESYHYVFPDFHSTRVLSETEQYLSIVRALYPSDFSCFTLEKLTEDYSARIRSLAVESKYILYPGGSSLNSVKRWPEYLELILNLGEENVIVIGGNDDLDFSKSWIYPFPLNKLPQPLLNQKKFWDILKKLRLLKPHAHFKGIKDKPYSYFNVFLWTELLALFRRSKGFIGNDGGLMHLAAAAGARGIVIFGPTSVNKNKPYNSAIRSVFNETHCQPCQFAVAGIAMTKNFINCPYNVKCLKNITAEYISGQIKLF
jgi:ADP-heptose:LPS heptosyltransferase